MRPLPFTNDNHFGFQLHAGFFQNCGLDMLDDFDYLRSLCGAFIDDEVGVFDRYTGITDAESFQSRFLDEAPCGVTFRVFEHRPELGSDSGCLFLRRTRWLSMVFWILV